MRRARFAARVPTITTERPRAFANSESRDCAVLALASVLCCEYSTARELLATAGKREAGHGTHDWQVCAAIRAAGYSVREHKSPHSERVLTVYGRLFTQRTGVSALRVLEFVPPRGHFYVTTTSHAFAVCDGVVYDNGGLRSGRGRLCSITEVIF